MHPSETDRADTILQKLDISADALNSMYATAPVGGFVGTEVARHLAERFDLDPSEPLGAQLAARGVLTEEEGAWLDDA